MGLFIRPANGMEYIQRGRGGNIFIRGHLKRGGGIYPIPYSLLIIQHSKSHTPTQNEGEWDEAWVYTQFHVFESDSDLAHVHLCALIIPLLGLVWYFTNTTKIK